MLHWHRKPLSNGREQYQNAITVEKQRLLDIKIDAEKQLEQESRLDLEQLLASIGLRDIQQGGQEFPLIAWGHISQLIQQQYRYQWDEWTTLARAEEIWKRHAETWSHRCRISDLLTKPLSECGTADLQFISYIALKHSHDFNPELKAKYRQIVNLVINKEHGHLSPFGPRPARTIVRFQQGLASGSYHSSLTFFASLPGYPFQEAA